MSESTKIDEAYAVGRTAWPQITVPMAQFREAFDVAGVHEVGDWAGDFYLACAAGCGDAFAITTIDRQFIARLPRRIQRLGAPPDAVDDVLQVVRERLFLGQSPRIRAYNAAAPLGQWIKVVAIRTAVDLRRRELAATRPVDPRWIEDLSPRDDVQTAVMQGEYKREFEIALREILGALSRRDRTVLRLHLIEQVSIERISVIYGVHRVTVARWVWDAGEVVLNSLRRHFRDRFGIEFREFDSLARLVRSRLSLDLGKILAADSVAVASRRGQGE